MIRVSPRLAQRAARGARLAHLLLVLALALGALVVPRRAGARPADEEITVLSPAPPPPSVTPVPALGAPPDLTSFVGLALVNVDVVLDDDRWPDERPPTITTMRG